MKRLAVVVKGAVQGVGFRPFVYRLAKELNLAGWVNNTSVGVFIEVEGSTKELESFLYRLSWEKPPRSVIQSLESRWLDSIGYDDFTIKESDGGDKTTIVLPDLSTCADCLREIFDPDNRRYRYPFTNCTNCGPRYSIIRSLPYDRPNTTMGDFPMCPDCLEEYHNPLDRRFHAQPNACPVCGPQITLWDKDGRTLAGGDEALHHTADAIREGLIVAIKGLGGFHLVVDARNENAVRELRERKKRPTKPLALMYPDLQLVKTDCKLSPLEEQLLESGESPIVLLLQKPNSLPPDLSPGNPYLGVMLPYTPLHHLLMTELGFPVVATSGNLSDEPICIDESEVMERLGGIADVFLVHDRSIVRPVDDSIIREVAGRPMMLRRARGYAPFPVSLPCEESRHILAVGGYFKNTVAIYKQNQVFISQHIGDLDNEATYRHFLEILTSLENLYDFRHEVIVSDKHPDYLSSQYAREQNLELVTVQHHHAHILSCMAENGIDGPVLGVAWDGTGYGEDRTIWGGEFLCVDGAGFERVAHFLPWPLPGGDKAVKEPRRVALGLLSVIGEEYLPLQAAFTPSEYGVLKGMIAKGLNSPLTSSAGRLFDGVAALLGLCYRVSFEGEAAMGLEFLARNTPTQESYPFAYNLAVIDWRPMVKEIMEDANRGKERELIAAKFHNTLVEIIVGVARHYSRGKIVLSGGCFQNRLLTEKAILSLQSAGFEVYTHHHIPPNDGGISLGQIAGFLRGKG